MPLAAHGVTHPGRRSSNEDAVLVDLGLGLFVVADGMGGHNAGEVASALAVETIRERAARADGAVRTTLHEAIRLANDRILAAAARDADYAGMGTTVAAALVDDARVVYAGVGDSRIYRRHSGTLVQLTRDDSWVSKVLASNGTTLTAQEAQQHPMRHILTEVVGLRADLQPEVAEIELDRGDALLLCSDGLHGVVSDEAIGAALASERSVADIAGGLLEEALALGGTDNVTVIVVRQE